MELNEYIEKGGQKLRLGYTTGSCAAAAAKAAAFMLLTGRKISQVSLQTPKGLKLILDIEDICFWDGEAVSCAVRKDSGDDPDITNHALIYSKVTRSDNPGIRIDGGEGVGRVTKPGLDQPVGNAAINSTPRRMIREAVLEVLQSAGENNFVFSRDKTENLCGPADRNESADLCEPADRNKPANRSKIAYQNEPADFYESAGSSIISGRDEARGKKPLYPLPAGLDITISVPQGRELAAKTFNPKLGIEGGISILGTSGIVEPMSDQALLDTIRVEVRVRREEGLTILPAAPGNYGKNFFLEKYGFSLETSVTASNFIFDTVSIAADEGFTHMLFVGHIGKLVKVAGGIRNTHSQYGDHRMEILTEIAKSILFQDEKRQGGNCKKPLFSDERTEAERYSKEETFENLRRELDDCVMTDEAINILRKYGLDREVLAEMTRRIQAVMQDWAGGRMQVEIVVFSNVHGELGRTEKALEYMQTLQEEISKI